LFDIRHGKALASSSQKDDAMMRRRRTPMTILQLKKSVERRFDRLDRRKVDKSDLLRLREEMKSLRTELRDEIARSAAETRRHMDVIAESLRDDLRLFADAIGLHDARLNQHHTRIQRLEQRSIQG